MKPVPQRPKPPRKPTREEQLGRLKPIRPASKRSDGSPVLGDGQVYVIKTGKVYHPYWCDVVGNKWDNNPKGLLVTLLADVGARQPCHNCTIV